MRPFSLTTAKFVIDNNNNKLIIIIIITDLYSAFKSTDTEALED